MTPPSTKPGRNEPCSCGSGRRYKHCCGMPVAASPPVPDLPLPGKSSLGPQEISALVALLQQGRLHEAEERALALLADHAGTGIVWKVLSVALVRQGRNALQALRRTAELMPDDPEAHSNLGSALLAQGSPAEALASLRRALALRPDDAATLIEAADALQALKRPIESVPLYEQALRLAPRAAEAHNNLGNALLALARPVEAAPHYRAALEAHPDDADIHCNLGNALRQQGMLHEAITASQRAIALNPALAMAHNNLGLAQAGLGQREAAAASYRQALALNPDYVEALDNLGAVLRDLGDYREAVALHARAVELDPQRPGSHCSLAASLYELRRVDEAVDAYRRALALQPVYPSARLGLATALRAIGRTDESEAVCRALLAVVPDHAAAWTLLGELHADRGQFQEAQTVLQRALALDPGHVAAYCSLAAHRRMTREDPTWLAGARALLERPLPLRQRMALHYALGKYFDDVAAHDDAFDHYRQANELARRHGPGYDRDKLVRLRLRITRYFETRRIEALQTAASASELPVFIIGMPRSGTSLAEQILASHPQVFGAGELRFWNRAFAHLDREGLDSEAAAGRVPAIGRDYLQELSILGGGAARVIDKMPANFIYAGLIHAALPGARIIHMRRHPLDTCLSVYFTDFLRLGRYASDLADLAHYYGEYRAFTDHWRVVLPETTLLEVPYEGLIEDQEGWSRRMLEFIGLPWDPRCLEFHQTQRVVITASRWQVRQKLHAGSVGRWRHYEKHLAPLLPLLAQG